MKNAAIVIVALLVLGGGYYMMKGQSTGDYNAPTTEEINSEQGAVKEFTLDSFEFGYDQKELTVKKGDTVTITLTNSGKMPHDWVVDEFGAKTKTIKNGETDTITFVAGATGEYEFYCSVGQHRANGMVGKLIVE